MMDDNDRLRAGTLPDDPAADCGPAPAPMLPSTVDPLRGLRHAPHVAMLGAMAMRARAVAPIRWAWDGIAPIGTTTVIAGGPSEGKTTLAFLLIIARACRFPVSLLGREVQPANDGQYVVLLEGEHGEASTARKLVRSAALLGLDDADTDAALDRIIVIARKGVTIGSPVWGDVVAMCAAGLVSDVVIDTIARVSPVGSDANAEADQVAVFDAVSRAIESAPVGSEPSCWILAHTRKGGTKRLDDVGGSIQRVGQADGAILLSAERREGHTVACVASFAKLRDVDPEDYPPETKWSVMGGRLTSEVAGRSAVGRKHRTGSEVRPTPGTTSHVTERPAADRSGTTKGAAPAGIGALVLATLQDGPATKTAIARALGRSKPDVDAALADLASRGEVREARAVVAGVERDAWALADAA